MKEYYNLRGFGKEAFSLCCSPCENCFFFFPEITKNILIVKGFFAQILAGKNTCFQTISMVS